MYRFCSMLRTLIVGIALCVGTSPTALGEEDFFALVGWDGEFARIGAATHDVNALGRTLPQGLQAIALSPDGTLYAGPGEAGFLYTVDPITGTAQPFLAIDTDIRGMAFSPTGELYITARENQVQPSMLRILSLIDGSHTDVGRLDGVGVRPQGLAFSPSGVLYALSPNEDNFDLYTVDMNDAEMHLVGSNSGRLHQGLDFTPDGSFYAVGPSVFGRVDPVSGAVLGNLIALSGDYRGVAFVPEPATLLLLLVGAALRRKHSSKGRS
jgi:hypothetical protein